MKEHTYNYNGFIYITQLDEVKRTVRLLLKTSARKRMPRFLYKFNSLSSYSIDAILKSYLFAAHPFQINDKYDCSSDLLDFSKISVNTFIQNLSIEVKLFSRDEIISMFNSDKKWILEKKLGDVLQEIWYMKFGIISLTTMFLNPLMWAYYSHNKGFVIKFDSKYLPKDFYGPFPINYAKSIDKIDFVKNDPSICIHYQTNIKSKIWKHENEWRYLAYNKDGKYHPSHWPDDLNSRKFAYNLNSIKEIILGYDFFDPGEIDHSQRQNGTDIIILNSKTNITNKNQKAKLLDFISKNKISTSVIMRHRKKFLFTTASIEVSKKSPYEYILNYGIIK